MKNKSFYSKILLFGEYSIIKNSKALSIPYPQFEGRLTFPRDNAQSIDPELKAFSLYLKKCVEKDALLSQFDISSFAFDVSQGLFFDSSIPQGYGAGSSGALVASVFDRYYPDFNLNTDVFHLKEVLAKMESHFHGSSSGIDPLISYLNSPMLINSKNDIELVTLPKFEKSPGGIFLLNTKRSRKTEPLMNLFLEKCRNEDFNQKCEEELIVSTNQCVKYFLEAKLSDLFSSFKNISAFQLEHFQPMIPMLYRDVWTEGLKTNHFYFKLCGAGGGGFLMGMTFDFQHFKRLHPDLDLKLLFSF